MNKEPMPWTDEELEEVLYHWDNTSFPILEFRYSAQKTTSSSGTTTASTRILPPTSTRTVAPTPAPVPSHPKNNNTESSSQDEPSKAAYLNIPINGDDIHVFEFYAPWCPHCQHFKPIYIQLANEIIKRSINVNVFFHSVSCTLNHDTCATYNIPGYPTFLAYRGGGGGDGDGGEDVESAFPDLVGNTTIRGTELDLGQNLNQDVEMLASKMKFDLASIVRNYTKSESKYSNSEDQRKFLENKIQKGLDVAKEKISLLENNDVTMNQLYHDAILSLTYILQNGVFYQSDAKLDSHSEVSALHDFIQLVYWSTPTSWNMRKTLVRDLLHSFDSVVTKGKVHVNEIIDRYSTTKNKNDNKIWGYIDPNEREFKSIYKRRHATNMTNHIFSHKNHDDNNDHYVNQKKWTSSCSRGPTSSGFTCGLWELFHIISIGSGLTQNQLYGFHHGYIVSQHEVVETIRNFIGNFFRCDICRTNFISMYDECGHDHCNRLSTDLPFSLPSKTRGEDQGEVALWLWEVHNAVNVRLLKERAQRERRNFTIAEELAAKFPTRNTCPLCWLDENMNEWDSVEVYNFLKGHYWPGQAGAGVRSSNNRIHGKMMHGDMMMEGRPLSRYGLYCTITPFLVMGCLFVRQYLLRAKGGMSLSLFLLRRKNKPS